MKKQEAVKLILFLVIGCAILFEVSGWFGVSNQYSEHAEMMMNGYYEEEENTLDMVVIGNSHVYRFWQSAFAWQEYGIAASSISTSDMPFGVMKNMVIEACKQQNPKVIVLDASVFARVEDEPNNKIYLLLNNMRYSANYFDTIKNFCYYSDVEGLDRLQYYFPLIQFHSRWDELTEADFLQTQPSYLNSCYQEKFLTSAIEPEEHIVTDERQAIEPKVEEALRDLLEWCKEQDTEVLFYAVPLLKKDGKMKRINYISDVIEEYGMEIINFNDPELYAEFGFDEGTDFQDNNHTNIKGSYKFTKVFGKYLMERYDLADHRGEALYADWDEKAQEYYNIVQPYLTGNVQ